jgi:hypothetical protein
VKGVAEGAAAVVAVNVKGGFTEASRPPWYQNPLRLRDLAGRLSLRTKWCHYVFMAKRVRTLKRVASGASQIQSKSALARAKRAARSELRRIFDEELKERESERRSLSRPAAASHSHS